MHVCVCVCASVSMFFFQVIICAVVVLPAPLDSLLQILKYDKLVRTSISKCIRVFVYAPDQQVYARVCVCASLCSCNCSSSDVCVYV